MLELGSGTGLVGLVAGHLGARVCITDQAYVFFPKSSFHISSAYHRFYDLLFSTPRTPKKPSHSYHGAQYLPEQIGI